MPIPDGAGFQFGGEYISLGRMGSQKVKEIALLKQ